MHEIGEKITDLLTETDAESSAPLEDCTLKFPLKTVAEVDEICKLIERDEDFADNLIKQLSLYSPIKGRYNLSSLQRVVTDELTLRYNWDGAHSKLALKKTILFGNIVFESWSSSFDGIFANYEAWIRKEITSAHNRENKRRSRARQQSQVVIGKKCYFVNLPLKSVEDVKDICKQIEDDEEFAEHLRKHLSKFNPTERKNGLSNLQRIVTDELTLQCNWDGKNSKLNLKETVLFEKIVFDAWKSSFDGVFANYEAWMIREISQVHNRKNKNFRETKQNVEKPLRNFIVNLPLASVKEIEDICKRIESDQVFADKLTKQLAAYTPSARKNSGTGIQKILTDELTLKYNWDGLHRKLCLKRTVLFHRIVFEAWSAIHDGNFENYVILMKKQIGQSHNRMNKRRSKAKRDQEEADLFEFVSIFGDDDVIDDDDEIDEDDNDV